jgi:cobalt-zinc-cadmium efflux system outer membrane protein
MKTNWVFALLMAASVARADDGMNLGDTNRVRLTPAFLQKMAEVMRTNHPGLLALQARARAASHATQAIRTWEDPVFKFGGVVASDRGPQLEEDGDLIYGLEQKLPLFGRPAAERRVAEKEAGVSVARHEMQFQLYRRDLARLLFAAALAETTLDLGRRDRAWIETLATTANERYQAGAGSQVEVLRLQNELARRSDQLKTEGQLRDHTWASINRLLNRPLTNALAPLQLPEVWRDIPYNSRLVTYAVKFEPKLRLMRQEIETADARVAATRKILLPDVTAGIEGRQYSGDGNFREGAFLVGLSLPWLNRGRYKSEIARDRARLDAAQLERADEELSVRESIHRLVIEIDAARREALLYRDEIIPRSRQAMEVSHSAWVAGRGMFLETMEARRSLLEAESIQARAVARQFETMLELVLCCGLGDLEALENLLQETP